jgi:hypothetical protein
MSRATPPHTIRSGIGQIILLALLFFSPLTLADSLRLFELKHRSSEELIPMLRPLLEPGAGISGSGFTLMVRSSEQDLAQLTELLEQLDQPQRQLLISLRQGHQSSEAGEGGAIDVNGEQNRVRIYGTRRQQLDSLDQQLRVQEGDWATIKSGVALPQVIQRRQQGPGGGIEEQGIEYREVDSGFEVRPRVSGEQVTLEIRPFHARPSPSGGGVIEQQEIITTIRGPLGEWMDLGGVLESQRRSGHGTIHATRERDRLQRNVQVKVESIP